MVLFYFIKTLKLIVLLSIADNAWKVADFGLTSEGTSRYAYPTHFARGTESYRAPELVREHSIVTHTSDIWALGCILYELAFQKRAFTHDYHVFEYIRNERRLEIYNLPVTERLKTYLRELILRMLDIDWRKRPSAQDVLRVMDSVLNSRASPKVFQIREWDLIEFQKSNPGQEHQATGGFVSRASLGLEAGSRIPHGLHLEDNDRRWATTIWSLCWYSHCSAF